VAGGGMPRALEAGPVRPISTGAGRGVAAGGVRFLMGGRLSRRLRCVPGCGKLPPDAEGRMGAQGPAREQMTLAAGMRITQPRRGGGTAPQSPPARGAAARG